MPKNIENKTPSTTESTEKHNNTPEIYNNDLLIQTLLESQIENQKERAQQAKIQLTIQEKIANLSNRPVEIITGAETNFQIFRATETALNRERATWRNLEETGNLLTSYMDRASGTHYEEIVSSDFVKSIMTIVRDQEIEKSKKKSRYFQIALQIQLAAIKANNRGKTSFKRNDFKNQKPRKRFNQNHKIEEKTTQNNVLAEAAAKFGKPK